MTIDADGYTWDFFIAHAGCDQVAAESLYDLLKEKARVFLDTRCVYAGDNWDEKLPEAQRRSLITIVLISSNTELAYYEKEEIAAAIALARANEKAHRVVPVYLEMPSVDRYGLLRKHSLTVSDDCALTIVAKQLLELLGQFPAIGTWLQQVAPRYKIERQLGQRNSALVYKAFDSTLKRDVAIKVFVNDRFQENFGESLREAVRISDEPGFITIYDACLEEKLPYYVMQFVDGPTLRERIDDYGEGLPVDVIRKIVLSIGDALIRAYSKKFLASDIKPSNIVLTKDDQPFLPPLNRFAKLRGRRLLQELRSRVPKLGERARLEELAYLLPEDFDEQLETVSSELSDEYKLGLVAYELVAGEIPPTLRSLKELEDKRSLAFQKLPGITARRSKCPKRIEQIILRMTSRSPRDRYEKLEDALNEMRRVVPTLSMARDSYQRCTETPESDTTFFKTFYGEFQRLCPQAKEKFQNFGPEGWQRQHQLLKQAILLLFVYCERAEWDEPNILTRVAQMHDRNHHNITAEFYRPFVEALVHTVCGYPPDIPEPLDLQCVDDESKGPIEQAWRNAVKPGINYMQSKY